MATLDKISADLKLAEFKLQDLRRSFEHLKSQPSIVSSITLQWQYIETHFNSLHSSLHHHLQSLKSQQQKQLKKSKHKMKKSKKPKIQSLCISMESEGLRLYLNDRVDDHESMREELSVALKLSPNTAKLVLDAVKGFHMRMRDIGAKLSVARKSCVLLLVEFMGLSVEIGSEVKEEAMKIANEWNEKVMGDEKKEGSVKVLGFLLFLGAFQLRKGFKKKKVLDLFECVCQRKDGPELVRRLGLVKKMPKLIQLLINKKLHLEAIRYIYAFELADKFSPVPLLKAHLKNSKKVAKKISKENLHGSENEAASKEVTALRAVMQCIIDHNLESEYSPESLKKRISQLKKEKAARKHIVTTTTPKDQPIQQCGKKRKKHTAPTPQTSPNHNTDPNLDLSLTHTSAPAMASDFKAQPLQQSAKKRKKDTAPNPSIPNPILTCTSASIPNPILTCTSASIPTSIPFLTSTSSPTSAPDFKAQPLQQCGKESKKHTTPYSKPDPILSPTSASLPTRIPIFTRTFVPTEPPNSKAQPPHQTGYKHPCTDSSANFVSTSYSYATSNSQSIQPHYWQSAGFVTNNSAPQFNQSAGHYSFSGSPSFTHNMSLSAGPYGLSGPTAVPLHHAGSSAREYGSGIPDNRPTPPQFGFAGPLNGYPGNVNAQQYRWSGTHPSMDHGANFKPSVPYYLPDAAAAPGYNDRPTSGGAYGLPPQYHPSYHS